MLAGPEEADSYQWWLVRDVVPGIEGWLAQGGQVNSGDCLRRLLPLETEKDAMYDESHLDDSDDQTTGWDADDTEPEQAAE